MTDMNETNGAILKTDVSGVPTTIHTRLLRGFHICHTLPAMTDMNETNAVIMKTDRRGRLRYTSEQKQTILDAFELSGRHAPRRQLPDSDLLAQKTPPVKRGSSRFAGGERESAQPLRFLLFKILLESGQQSTARAQAICEFFKNLLPMITWSR